MLFVLLLLIFLFMQQFLLLLVFLGQAKLTEQASYAFLSGVFTAEPNKIMQKFCLSHCSFYILYVSSHGRKTAINFMQ